MSTVTILSNALKHTVPLEPIMRKIVHNVPTIFTFKTNMSFMDV